MSTPIDLEELVVEWAKTMFDMTKSKEQAKINKDALQYNVNWKWVRVHHSDAEYNDKAKPAQPKSQVSYTLRLASYIIIIGLKLHWKNWTSQIRHT